MGIALPKLQVGRFLRKEVAPLIPGGASVADRVNGIIKDVKTGMDSGKDVLSSTKAALTEANVQYEKRKYLYIIAAIAGGLLLIYLARRR